MAEAEAETIPDAPPEPLAAMADAPPVETEPALSIEADGPDGPAGGTTACGDGDAVVDAAAARRPAQQELLAAKALGAEEFGRRLDLEIVELLRRSLDREAAARFGLTVGDVQDVFMSAIGGRARGSRRPSASSGGIRKRNHRSHRAGP